MGVNNTIYQNFQNMLDGYKNNNRGLFECSIRDLMYNHPESPYKVDSEEHKLFESVHFNYRVWAKGGVGSNISYRRMVSKAEELCSIIKNNPFKFSEKEAEEDEKIEQEEEKKLLEEIKKQEEMKNAEEIKKQKELLKKDVIDDAKPDSQKIKKTNGEETIVLGVVPENKEEKKSWHSFLHPWKKEGELNDSKRADQ